MRASMRRLGQVAAVCSLALGLAAGARADETSGTWTGAATLRGNYYWERSTRVIAPEGGLEVTAPNGVRMHANYLVDTITSASVAAGIVADIRFTELRHDLRAGAGYTFDLGGPELDVDASGHFSTESDYVSRGASLGAALSLDDRATVLRLDASFADDTASKILRGAQRSVAGRDLSNRGVVGTLDVLALSLSWAQTITPELVSDVGYDFGGLWGLQTNPYRTVSVQGANRDETHPDTRYRHTFHAGLAYYVRTSRTAIHALYRVYLDSWDIAALNPEVRVYQELGDDVVLRTRYRFFTQTAAYFTQAPALYVADDPYVTTDPKMTAFHTHLLGVSALVRLGFLDGTALSFAHRFELDFAFDYLWNTNRYGDGVIAQIGLRAPF